MDMALLTRRSIRIWMYGSGNVMSPVTLMMTKSLSTSDTKKSRPSMTELIKKYGMAGGLVYTTTYITVLSSIYLAIDTNIATIISPSFDVATNINTVSESVMCTNCNCYCRHAITLKV